MGSAERIGRFECYSTHSIKLLTASPRANAARSGASKMADKAGAVAQNQFALHSEACTSAAAPAGFGAPYRIHAEQVAAGEEKVVCSRQLAVEPDVDVDDRHSHQLLQAAEVRQALPGWWNLLFQDVHCVMLNPLVVKSKTISWTLMSEMHVCIRFLKQDLGLVLQVLRDGAD